MKQNSIDDLRSARAIVWGASATLILLPLLGLKWADARAWEVEDLPFAIVMVVVAGLAFEVALRIRTGRTYHAGAALAAGAAFLLTWGNLAVGFAGSEDNAINIIFFAVPAVAAASSLIARFQAAGLAKAMATAAGMQFAAGLLAFYYGFFTGPLTVTFVALWLASSLLFYRSAGARAPVQPSA